MGEVKTLRYCANKNWTPENPHTQIEELIAVIYNESFICSTEACRWWPVVDIYMMLIFKNNYFDKHKILPINHISTCFITKNLAATIEVCYKICSQ